MGGGGSGEKPLCICQTTRFAWEQVRGLSQEKPVLPVCAVGACSHLLQLGLSSTPCLGPGLPCLLNDGQSSPPARYRVPTVLPSLGTLSCSQHLCRGYCCPHRLDFTVPIGHMPLSPYSLHGRCWGGGCPIVGVSKKETQDISVHSRPRSMMSSVNRVKLPQHSGLTRCQAQGRRGGCSQIRATGREELAETLGS